MQSLKNQHSVSDSPNQNGTQPHLNGTYHEIPVPQQLPAGEPEFLPEDEPITSRNEIKIHVEPLTEPEQQYIPSPEESTVEEPARVSRSLRMQWRFWRTLVYAGLLFVRVLFWQVYVARYFPGYVRKNELKRWVKYSRGFRKFAIAQGGVFIKLGQFISTRVDILPEAIIKELESLQDEVPTIPFEQIRRVIENELGALDERYSWFNPEPIAAASLGQVHRAKLKDGTRVVVKVQRPNIRTICYTDLAAMRVVAQVAMRFQFISRRADAEGLVEEFGTVLLEELSYKHEAYNAARFAEAFKHDRGVYIPTVHYDHSTDQVLTIEDVTSIKITDFEAMEKAGISRKQVAKRLMDTYLKQVFDEYFFHADPHPGNLFVYPLPVEDENADFGANGRPFYLIFVDFGMTGTLTHEIADGMVTTLYSVLTRDVDGLIKSYQRLGFLLPGADIPRITEAARAAFDQVWGLSMMELKQVDYDKMVDLAEEFSDLMLSMPFYIPQDFIYLGRTISILSGMCTSLDPLYNPWYDLQPYTEKLIARGFGVDIPRNSIMSRQQIGVSIMQSLFSGNGVQILRSVGEEVIRRTVAPVTRADDALRKLEKGELRIVTELSLPHRQQLKRIERESRTTSRAVFFGSVLITSTIFYTSGDTTIAAIGYIICGITWISGVLRG